jgi:hypothetical protein
MPLTVSCPYCNAPVPVPYPPPANGRVFCQRCEEAVAIAGVNDEASTTAPVPSPAAASRPSNRAIAGLVIAVMLGMAALGLAFALQTISFRRANDTKGAQPPEQVPETRPSPPAEWPGLGYLPEGVQAVAGIRVADAFGSPAGRQFVESLGFTDKVKRFGLSVGDIGEFVIGVNARTLPPRVTAVIRTRTPVGERQIVTALGTDRTGEQHGKKLHRGRLWPNGPDGAVWQPDPTTLVATLMPEDFDHVPAKPRSATPLSDLMRRLDPAALAWLAASVDASDAALALAASLLPPADRDAWTKLEALAVSVRADGSKLTLTAHLRGRDVDAGWAIAKALADSLKTPAAEVMVNRPQPGDWYRLTAIGDVDKLAGRLLAK